MKRYRIKELGDIVTGNTPSKKNLDYYNSEDIPFFKPDSLDENEVAYLTTAKEYLSSNAKSVARIVPRETVLFSCIGSIGKIGITNVDNSSFNQQINAIIPNKEIILPKYLCYALKYNKKKIQAIANAAVVPIINKTQFSEFEISIHQKEEQVKVVNILDQAQELIDKRKAQIEALDELVQSVFYDMFGDPVINEKSWNIDKFKNLGELKRGKSSHRPRNAPELLNGPYPLIQTGDIANAGLYIKEYDRTYSELGLQQSKMWPKGTLCITIAANIAKTGILTFDSCFPDSVVAFINDDNIVNKMYIQIWMSFLQSIIEESAPESAQKNINLKILGELDVIIPPIELQNQFAEIVENIEKQKELLNESLVELENNFNSLMQRAFSGGSLR